MSTAPTNASFDPHAVERFGAYEVVRYLAEGGMAWVYEARDPRFPARRLALKVLKPQAGRSPADLRSARSTWIYWGEAYPSASIRRNKGQGETASLDAGVYSLSVS